MVHELPQLSYDYNAVEPHIDAQTMEIHHSKHHAGYVAKLNAALEGTGMEDKPIGALLRELDQVPEDKRGAVRNNGGGHANHTLYWDVIKPGGASQPSGALAEAITAAFGSYEAFAEQFSTAAATHFGSGWAWLCVGSDGLHIETTLNQDNPMMHGHTPILGIDVWEHAYYLKHQNKRPDYIAAFVQLINWDEVDKRFSAANL